LLILELVDALLDLPGLVLRAGAVGKRGGGAEE
jgi:hypothetical protein